MLMLRVSDHRRMAPLQHLFAPIAILLLGCARASAQEHDPEAIATWKSLAAAGQDHTPPSSGYQAGIYRSLSEELAANQHSRFTIELKPERDLLEIILTLLDWKEQDTEQIWIRPVAHVDSAEYDSETPSGMEAALLTFMRKARHSTDDEAIQQFTSLHNPAGQHTRIAVLDALQRLRASGQITSRNGVNSISWRIPGQYKMDLRGDVNVLRKALLVALQQMPGIVSAHMDENFIHNHHPAWYEVSAEPWDY